MIGIFDSGIGGLTVLKEIRNQLPDHNFIYIADSAFTPYGEKTTEQIIERSVLITQKLVEKGCRIIVVACNTATALAVDHLREKFSVPIVAMEPAVKPGVKNSVKKKVGILATTMTLASRRYMNLLERFATDTEVIEQPCPGLVELVEAMAIDTDKTSQLLHQYINPLLKKGIDTIVLGCTHYPLLKQKIIEVTGEDIEIIDTAKAVTEQLRRKIESCEIPAKVGTANRFITTGDLMFYKNQLQCYWPMEVAVEQIDLN
ncbi:MAG: glutamate racemase [Gammaproteobacteria bacterium]|nr:glutamate racemase [Gammaproteobacteria bacterium]